VECYVCRQHREGIPTSASLYRVGCGIGSTCSGELPWKPLCSSRRTLVSVASSSYQRRDRAADMAYRRLAI